MIAPELVFPSLVMVLIALSARITHGSWLAPGPMFSLAWAALIWMSLLSPLWGAPVYPVWEGALWWIDASVAALVFGSLIGTGPAARLAAIPPRQQPVFRGWRAVVIVGVAAGSIHSLLYLGSETDLPTVMQLILVPHHAGPILGAVFFVSVPDRRRYLALLTLVPGMFTGLVGVGRTAFLSPVIFWISGVLAYGVFLGGKRLQLFSAQRMAAGLAFVAGALSIGVTFQIFRSVLVPKLSLTERLAEYLDVLTWSNVADAWVFMQTSFWGHISAFSAWFELTWNNPPAPSLGSQTLNGIFRLTGFRIAETEYVDVDGISTNVFTLFKPPIGDFTLVGALLFFFVIGLAAGAAYRRLREGHLWPLSILAAFYVHCFLTGGWFFNYNSVTASYIVPGVYLYWVQRRVSQRRPAGMRAGVFGRTPLAVPQPGLARRTR